MRFLVRSAIGQHSLRGRSIGTAREFSCSRNNSNSRCFSFIKDFWTTKITIGQSMTSYAIYKLVRSAFELGSREERTGRKQEKNERMFGAKLSRKL